MIFGDVLGRVGELVVFDDHERSLQQRGGELQLDLQHRGTRAFGADQGAGDIKSALREQLVEVVARDAARQLVDRPVALADLVAVAVAQVTQLPRRSRLCVRRWR